MRFEKYDAAAKGQTAVLEEPESPMATLKERVFQSDCLDEITEAARPRSCGGRGAESTFTVDLMGSWCKP